MIIPIDLIAVLKHRKEMVLFSNGSSLSFHSSIGECHSRFLFMMVPFPILRLSHNDSIKWNFWFSNLFTGLPRERCVMCATTHSHICIQIQVLNSFTILNLITLFYTYEHCPICSNCTNTRKFSDYSFYVHRWFWEYSIKYKEYFIEKNSKVSLDQQSF